MFKQPKSIVTASAFAVVAILASPAFAGESPEPADTQQVTVSFSDLDLSQQAGGQAGLNRLRKAASQVCRRNSDRRIEEQRAYRHCRQTALAQAVQDANRPMLTAAYRGPIVMARSDGTSGS